MLPTWKLAKIKPDTGTWYLEKERLLFHYVETMSNKYTPNVFGRLGVMHEGRPQTSVWGGGSLVLSIVQSGEPNT